MPIAHSSASKEVVTAALLMIGGKILSGRTKDQNIGYIAEYLTAVGIIAVGACGFPVSAADLFKVGFVFRDSVGEYGWTYQHELGRVAIEKKFGNRISTDYLANVDDGLASERSIEQLARSGQKLIFTTSVGFMDPTIKIAKKYPNVFFEQNMGYVRDANVATYSARSYEGRFIQGQIAAKMSRTGVLGYIGSYPIPEVISGINSTMLGAQSVNQNIKIKIIWLNTWFDPDKEADAARTLLEEGADVLMQHTESPAPTKVASEQNKFAFGQVSDMIKFGPKSQLTAIINNWAPYYIDRVQLLLDGKWIPGEVWGGLNTKMITMAPYTNVPDDVKNQAIETEAAISAKILHPFKCPVFAQSGNVLECKGGANLDDEQILGMNFYVKGIDDKMPSK
jgi:basic membrane protein A